MCSAEGGRTLDNNLVSGKKRALAYGIGAILVLSIPFLFINIQYLILVACFIEIYAIGVSGLDVLFGYSGQISMGHAAFFAIGAYGSVLIHSPGRITGNSVGLYTDSVSIFGFELDTYTRFFYFGLVLMVLFLLAKKLLIGSRTGRAFIAIRENTHAADGMGINVRKYKIIAFALSGFYMAFAGAMYAHLTRYISPDTFTNKQSVMFITMLLFGGTGSLFGPIVGCITLMSITELLRSAQNYMTLIYSILMLLVIVALPGGLYGMVRDIILSRRARRLRALEEGGRPHA